MKQITINTSFKVFNSQEELPFEIQNLMDLAVEARKKAYAPYSKFRVGTALLLDNGKVVIGSNQENAAYPSGLCAERVAVFHAGAAYPDAKITKMAITAASDTNPTKIYFMGETGEVYQSDSIKNLLPLSFDKNFL